MSIFKLARKQKIIIGLLDFAQGLITIITFGSILPCWSEKYSIDCLLKWGE